MRIGIVNDVALAREALRRIVLSTGEHQVSWMAADGAEAIALARADRPDVILMDLLMPHVDGVEATRRIMSETPCPILVVTASVGGNLSKVFQAMGFGALDAVDTPQLGPEGELRGGAVLLYKLEIIGRLSGKVASELRRSSGRPGLVGEGGSRLEIPVWRADQAAVRLVALGASTGGPQALAEILRGLPDPLQAAVILVQHVDAAFAPGLSKWLGDQLGRPVMLIEEGLAIEPEMILLSSTNDHLVLGDDGRLRYTSEPGDVCYRPSVDVFFQSLARRWPLAGVAALLTGMGCDGAVGLLALRKKGWRTLAQDEATSVVWGMPKAAALMGAAEQVLPLPRIGPAIGQLLAASFPPHDRRPRSGG